MKTFKLIVYILGIGGALLGGGWKILSTADARYASVSQADKNYQAIAMNSSRDYARDLQQAYRDLRERKWAIERRYSGMAIPQDIKESLEMIKAEMRDIQTQLDILKENLGKNMGFNGKMAK